MRMEQARGIEPMYPVWKTGAQPLCQARFTLLIVPLTCLMLTGCVTTGTNIPIAVSCVKEAPAVPVVATEAEILAMTEYAATLTTWTERLLLKAYAAKAEAVIAACQ